MAKRHRLAAGDWASVAGRLGELVAAGSGAPPLEVALSLVVARLEADRAGAALGPAAARARAGDAAARWPDLLPTRPLDDVPDAVLAACLAALAPLRLTGATNTALDALLEGLTARSRRGDKGQFLTPRHVCTALTRLVDPQPGERVLDPACGAGGFLVAAALHGATGPLIGVDLDPLAVRLSRLYALLGDHDLSVSHGDALRPGGAPEGADVILTNPPFAGDVRDPALLAAHETAGLLRPERDVLFLERCVRLLRPGGRLGIVLPAGRLASRRAAPLRRWLVRHLQLTVVVSLPAETFQPHTSLRTGLLVGRRRPTALAHDAPLPDEPIHFALSERAGRDRRGRPMLRPGADPEAHPWRALDHDLDAVVAGAPRG